LNTRISMFSCADSGRIIAPPSMPSASSSRIRTRTPRSAAARRALSNSCPGLVLLQNEVLDVERFLGLLRDLHPQGEALGAVGQQPETRHSGMLFRARREALAQRRGLGGSEGGRLGLRDFEPRRHRRATPDEQRERNAYRRQEAVAQHRSPFNLPSAARPASAVRFHRTPS
jgi:hypothetical protein